MFTYNEKLNGYVSDNLNDIWPSSFKKPERDLEREAQFEKERELKQKKLEQAVKDLEIKYGWNNDRRAN